MKNIIKIYNNNKVKFSLGGFEFFDYLDNQIIDILEDMNLGLTHHKPILLRFEVPTREYYLLLNKEECYFWNTEDKKLNTIFISLEKIVKEFYTDIIEQLSMILQNTFDILETEDHGIKEIYDLNLRSLHILMNQDNFSYKGKNLTESTLNALNDGLFLHTDVCVYDNYETTESFRVITDKKTYLITKTLRNEKYKRDMEIIPVKMTDVAVSLYKELSSKHKLLTTKQQLDNLKHNLKEYNVILA